MLKPSLISLVFTAGLAGSVLAAPQYIDATRCAISGYDAVAYFNGGPQTGKKELTTFYNGTKVAFLTAATPSNPKKSTRNWEKQTPNRVSNRPIPSFSSTAPN